MVVLAEDMGSLVSRVQGFCGRRTITEALVVMFGMDGGGKTTILYRLKLNKVVQTIPTIGHNAESLDIVDDMPLLVWDVGLGAKGWPLLRHYLSGCNGFVFVVDSTDTEIFQEAKENLFMVLNFTEIVDIPFIVLANKQDLEGACSPSEVALYLDLERIQYNKWAVFGCSGLTGEGVKEALEKLCTMIKEHRSL